MPHERSRCAIEASLCEVDRDTFDFRCLDSISEEDAVPEVYFDVDLSPKVVKCQVRCAPREGATEVTLILDRHIETIIGPDLTSNDLSLVLGVEEDGAIS